MKKVTYLTIVFLLWGAFTVHSQLSDFQTNKLSVGVIGGLNFASMYFPNHQGADDDPMRGRNSESFGTRDHSQHKSEGDTKHIK